MRADPGRLLASGRSSFEMADSSGSQPIKDLMATSAAKPRAMMRMMTTEVTAFRSSQGHGPVCPRAEVTASVLCRSSERAVTRSSSSSSR
jgi:hypothetical protein